MTVKNLIIEIITHFHGESIVARANDRKQLVKRMERGMEDEEDVDSEWPIHFRFRWERFSNNFFKTGIVLFVIAWVKGKIEILI